MHPSGRESLSKTINYPSFDLPELLILLPMIFENETFLVSAVIHEDASLITDVERAATPQGAPQVASWDPASFLHTVFTTDC